MADGIVVCAPVGSEVVSTGTMVIWDCNRAVRDVTRLLEASEAELAGGDATVALRTVLPRAAAPAGSEGLAADRDLATETGAAEVLNDRNLNVAAVVVRAAVAWAASRPAGQETFKGPGDRP